jgi:hypothetical protein
MKRFYLVFGLGMLGVYSYAEAIGWEMQTAPRQVLPAGVRQSPGGYRSFHFWHTGWQGGK